MKLIDADLLGLTDMEIIMCDGDYKEALKMLIDKIDSAPTIEPPRWIPVSERLPEEHDSIFNRFYGTERFTKAMWRKQSDKVIVTELFEDGTMRTSTACTHDGEWYADIKFVKCEIIAWMPLPEPYEEGNNEQPKQSNSRDD